jgi:hypothetical protein
VLPPVCFVIRATSDSPDEYPHRKIGAQKVVQEPAQPTAAEAITQGNDTAVGLLLEPSAQASHSTPIADAVNWNRGDPFIAKAMRSQSAFQQVSVARSKMEFLLPARSRQQQKDLAHFTFLAQLRSMFVLEVAPESQGVFGRRNRLINDQERCASTQDRSAEEEQSKQQRHK